MLSKAGVALLEGSRQKKMKVSASGAAVQVVAAARGLVSAGSRESLGKQPP